MSKNDHSITKSEIVFIAQYEPESLHGEQNSLVEKEEVIDDRWLMVGETRDDACMACADFIRRVLLVSSKLKKYVKREDWLTLEMIADSGTAEELIEGWNEMVPTNQTRVYKAATI